VSIQPGAYRADAVLEEVTGTLREIAKRDYGIDLVDVQLQRFDFPERNRLRVYARMKSERARISMKYRSEGEEEGLKVRAAADQEKSRLLSEAYKVSEQHLAPGRSVHATTPEALSTLVAVRRDEPPAYQRGKRALRCRHGGLPTLACGPDRSARGSSAGAAADVA
jgi:regulator of protease activity HflC (stomatin/prohibitin superfamily)